MNRLDKTKVLLSCLQKSIRRCDDLGLKCCVQLDIMNNNGIWRKLAVYSAEDIGRAYPNITSYLCNQHQYYDKEKDIWKKRLILCNTVYFFIQQNKSRIADNVNHAYFKLEQPIIDDTITIDNIKKQFIESIKNKDVDQSLIYGCHLYLAKEITFLIESISMNDKESECLEMYFYKFELSKLFH